MSSSSLLSAPHPMTGCQYARWPPAGKRDAGMASPAASAFTHHPSLITHHGSLGIRNEMPGKWRRDARCADYPHRDEVGVSVVVDGDHFRRRGRCSLELRGADTGGFAAAVAGAERGRFLRALARVLAVLRGPFGARRRPPVGEGGIRAGWVWAVFACA